MDANFNIEKKLPKKKVAISIDAELDEKIAQSEFKRSELINELLKKYFEMQDKKASLKERN